MTSCLLSSFPAHQIHSEKGVYSGRKFLPYSVGSFSEERRTNFDRVIYPVKASVALKLEHEGCSMHKEIDI